MFIGGGLIGLFFLYVTDDDSGHRGNRFDTLIDGVQGAAAMDPHALLYIVLPPLLYESASAMDWHVLRKLLPSAILLAVPGVMLNTFLTGCFVKLFVTIGDKSPKWEESWLLGSILSATDPVAVVAALAELGAPKKLSGLVEGESLLNDGSAVVCAYVFLEWSSPLDPDKYCEGENGPGTRPRPQCVMGYFLQVAGGGFALGILTGAILYYWLKLVKDLQITILEIGIVFTAVYGLFFCAEALHTSGVLAVVTLGFVMAACGLHRMSHDGRHNHHVNLSQVAYFCNQVAFFVAGIVSSRFMYSDKDTCDHSAASLQAWLELFGLYAVIHLTRGLVVVTFWPFLKRWGYGINWKEACIMVYGGLRGAVGLVMGLIVEHHKYIDTDVAQMVAFHTSGIVLLTLFINGSTIDGLYRRLDMYPKNQYRMIHVRKSLVKLEAEVSKKGIKKIANDWYFRDCSLKKLLRCVPRFTHVRFDESDAVCAEHIESVQATLNSIISDAEKFKLKQPFIGPPEMDFETKWRTRKGQEWETKVSELMNMTANMVEKKDLLKNVHNSGDYSLLYRPPESKAQAGFFVSSRSAVEVARNVTKEETSAERSSPEDSILEFEMQQTREMQIIVGLIASDEDLRQCHSGDLQVIGTSCANSIGFNCYTCDVQFNGPSGQGFVETQEAPLVPGEMLSICFHRQPKGDWEVCFSVSGVDGEEKPKIVISVPFGPFQPSELYPVVEFRYIDRTKMVQLEVDRSRTRSEPSLSKCESTFGLLPSLAVSEQMTKAQGAVEDTGKAMLSAAKAGIDVVTGIFKGKENDESEILKSWSKDKHDGARVQLSFEPMLASDRESINELFHVLFNTVMHEYTEMHEHGIIGDAAYAYLTETIGMGLDCANHEVNAMRLANYKSVSSSTTPAQEGDLQPTKSRSQKFQSEAVQKMKKIFNKLRIDEKNATFVSLFEPLIVEYLSLENVVATDSFLDRVLRRTIRVMMFGFRATQTKVECLWAFITAHEEVLHESVVFCRFPDLVKCITTLMDLAKEDLKILQEVQPRRYFYSKHILALRVILNKRLLKLKKFVHAGWMTTADAGGLMDEFWSRIVQADQFFPQIGSSKDGDENENAKTVAGKAGMSGSELSSSKSNAWADVELPRPDTANTGHDGMTNVRSLHSIQITTAQGSSTQEGQESDLRPATPNLMMTHSRSNLCIRVANPHKTRFGLHTPTAGNLEALSESAQVGEVNPSAVEKQQPNSLLPSASDAPSENQQPTALKPSSSAGFAESGTLKTVVLQPLSVVPSEEPRAPDPPGVVNGDDLDTILTKTEKALDGKKS
jgi:NhaP-type Na+/H+ or K+/H+ antiporter